ncbi:HNH endonuclease signature motif containing protein [Reyranella sp.]|uniref:HNH endonuclease signature motif containing protein n=1 Tax=Reyranella sp. TaxID=1929291 RepID=UPI002726D944|nr:HNH endonuclease signature motif containing protein [Reyranella sp.]MDO8974349.1 HNH endonuclease signature motif containing protein [Reyranella sp.]
MDPFDETGHDHRGPVIMTASIAARAKHTSGSFDCFIGSNTIMGLQALQPRVGLADLRTAALPPKVAEPFYSSPAWIALRDRVRREAGGRCQVDGCGRVERRMFVDHIVELKDGGAPLERTNVWLLCASHHSLKTVAERAKRTARRPGGP